MSSAAPNNGQGKLQAQQELNQRVDELTDILTRQKSFYENFLELARSKKEALIANNLEELSDIVAGEDELTQKIETLEAERKSISERISQLLGKEEINISLLLDYIEGERSEQLAAVQEEMQDLLDELSRQNEQNRQLLLQAMKLNEISLKMFLQGTDKDKFYQAPDGQQAGQKEESKQINNIIDRRA